MTLPDLYPVSPPLEADRNAAIRAVVIEAASRSAIRPRFRFRWQTAGLVAAVALLFGLIAAQFWLPPQTTWAATPEFLDAEATAQLARACTEAIVALDFPMTVLAAQAVIGESRGDSSAVISATAGQAQLCVNSTGRNFVGIYELNSVPAGAMGTVDGVPGTRDGGEALRLIFGRLSAEVTGVTVVTADNRSITASVADRYFFAWWPSHADAAEVTVRLQSGETGSLTVPDQSPPEPAPASGPPTN